MTVGWAWHCAWRGPMGWPQHQYDWFFSGLNTDSRPSILVVSAVVFVLTCCRIACGRFCCFLLAGAIGARKKGRRRAEGGSGEARSRGGIGQGGSVGNGGGGELCWLVARVLCATFLVVMWATPSLWCGEERQASMPISRNAHLRFSLPCRNAEVLGNLRSVFFLVHLFQPVARGLQQGMSRLVRRLSYLLPGTGGCQSRVIRRKCVLFRSTPRPPRAPPIHVLHSTCLPSCRLSLLCWKRSRCLWGMVETDSAR